PILLLIRDFNDLDMIAADVSEKALCLARACWPGPVTLLFKAAPNLSRLLTGAQAKIGCRISSNHIAQKLVEYVGAPITSTSANLSGNASASNIKLLDNVLYNLVDVVIDAGDTGSNVASTIIDVSGEPFTVVRKGTILPDLSVYL
ncbi:MAG: Sua5/YciO/YrdC/YwlC family protein, partial [Desulfobacterota bacterium]|nr:Sua5/YciO/YrdC/YwlC family protein [Thermodesulfobacteriota bacterium]